jgi:hypothetical protein
MASKAGRPNGVPWRLLGWGGAVALLTVPLLLQFPWTLSDFIFAGAVFAIVGGTFELAVRKSGNKWYRGGVAVALATAFLLVWINGAVGVIGDEGNSANLMFMVVILMAIAGAIASRFEAAGMARAMFVAAAANGLICAIVAVNGLGAGEPPGFPEVLILTAGFAGMWGLSALLFRQAGGTGNSVEG